MLLLWEIFHFNGWTKIVFKSILKSRIFTTQGEHQIFTSCFWEGHSNSWLLLLKSTFPKVFDAFCKNQSKGIVQGRTFVTKATASIPLALSEAWNILYHPKGLKTWLDFEYSWSKTPMSALERKCSSPAQQEFTLAKITAPLWGQK